MRLRRFFAQCTFGTAALALTLSAFAAPASAADTHYWFWTTAGDANPLPVSECTKRASGALKSAGLNSGQMGSNPDTFYGTSDTAYVMLMCIPQTRGFFMVLDVAVSGGSRPSVDLGNAVNAAFWGTGGSTVQPQAGAGAGWRLSSNCGWVTGNWQATLSLTQAPNGLLSGTVTGDNLAAGGTDVLADSSGSWNGGPPAMRSMVSGSVMTLVLHPKSWISVIQLTGQINGNQISGNVHHYTNDDCQFTLVRG
jgi:hypothetical protein